MAQSAAGQPSNDCSNRLERLFNHWRKLVQLQSKSSEKESLVRYSAGCSAPIDPWVLVDSAKFTEANNLRELLFKLAFWRWKNSTIGANLHDMNDNDALVYSAYLDLLRLTDEKSVILKSDQCALDRELEFRLEGL